eukprot:TRINITY_DN17123_c1_g1_i1.p1 TRINITY_DN17123_c1_g1~~TRINITY_DN17123_c1_g1_i1.p1  ORF type:complete len:225 (-),score=26.92 TRINITY_DN17123_c1_g1_i1:262-855(-)
MNSIQSVSQALYFGDLDPKVDKQMLYEIATQAGPVEDINVIKKGDGFTYAFVKFRDLVETNKQTRFLLQSSDVTQVSSVYAYALFSDGLLCLFNRPVKIGFSKENPWQGAPPSQVFDILRTSGKFKQEALLKLELQEFGDGGSYSGLSRQRSESFQSSQCGKSGKQELSGSLHGSHSSDHSNSGLMRSLTGGSSYFN